MKDFEPYIEYIRARLSPGRFEHSISVAKTAVEIGTALGFDEGRLDKIKTAGLLHDMTKETPREEQFEIISRGGGVTEPDDLAAPAVLHQISGAYAAREVFAVDDEVFGMIRYHCTGKPGMSLDESIVSLADYIEPTRKHDFCRELNKSFFSAPITEASVRAALKKASDTTIEHLISKNYPIHHLALDTYNT